MITSAKPSQYMLQQARQHIFEFGQYDFDEQRMDGFMRQILRAVSIGNIELFKELLVLNQEYHYDYESWFRQKYGLSTLQSACQNGRRTLIEFMLINQLGDVNEVYNGVTPLFLLAQHYCLNPNRNVLAFEMMIQHGADPLIKNQQGVGIMEIICYAEQETDTIKYIKRIYFEKEREQAMKNLILWTMSDNNTLSPWALEELIKYIK